MSKRTPKGMGSVLEYRPGKYRTWLDLGVDEYGKKTPQDILREYPRRSRKEAR